MGSPLLKNQACGFYHTPSQSHNEVIIDPRTWNAHIKDNLWAFVLTDACTGACETSLRRLHDGGKKKNTHFTRTLRMRRLAARAKLKKMRGPLAMPPQWSWEGWHRWMSSSKQPICTYAIGNP